MVILSETAGGAVEDLLAHERADQIDHQLGGAPALVQKRVQLDQIQRGHQPAFVQKLADQMRLAEGGAAGDGGADGGRDRGSRKSTSRLTCSRPLAARTRVQKFAQGGDDAALVQHAHVVHGDVIAQQGLRVRRIDAADAEQADALGRDRRRKGRKGVKAAAPGDIGDGRAVQIARHGGQRGVEIAMRVQPQQEQRPAGAGRMLGRTRDRTQRQRMIAPQRDRHAATGQHLGHAVAQHLGPAQRLVKLVDGRVVAAGMRQHARRQVAQIADLMAQIGQQPVDPGDAIGGGTHQAAKVALAGIDGGADKGNSAHSSLHVLHRKILSVCGDFKQIFD
jgi:hypothetical protein